MKVVIGILLALVVLFSCGEKRGEPSIGQSESLAEFDAMAVNSKEDAKSNVISDRQLIKDGSLSFETGDIKKAQTDIAGIIKSLNGYASSETAQNGEGRPTNQITIRVPSNQFEILVEKLEKIALKVEYKSIQSRDVTEEFFDAEARLRTKKEVESRYRELLKKLRQLKICWLSNVKLVMFVPKLRS